MERHHIAFWPKAGNLAGTDRRCDRFVAEFFARVDIGKMDFDFWDVDAGQGVSDYNTGVGVAGTVNNQAIIIFGGGLDKLDNFGFGIGLLNGDGQLQFFGFRLDHFIDFGQRF